MSKTGHADINDRRVDSFEALVVEPPASHHVRAEVLSDHVADRGQLPKNLLALGRGEIQARAELVAVEVDEHSSRTQDARVERHLPHLLTAGSRLHLDYLGAEIGQEACGLRTRNYPGEVRNAYS